MHTYRLALGVMLAGSVFIVDNIVLLNQHLQVPVHGRDVPVLPARYVFCRAEESLEVSVWVVRIKRHVVVVVGTRNGTGPAASVCFVVDDLRVDRLVGVVAVVLEERGAVVMGVVVVLRL